MQANWTYTDTNTHANTHTHTHTHTSTHTPQHTHIIPKEYYDIVYGGRLFLALKLIDIYFKHITASFLWPCKLKIIKLNILLESDTSQTYTDIYIYTVIYIYIYIYMCVCVCVEREGGERVRERERCKQSPQILLHKYTQTHTYINSIKYMILYENIYKLLNTVHAKRQCVKLMYSVTGPAYIFLAWWECVICMSSYNVLFCNSKADTSCSCSDAVCIYSCPCKNNNQFITNANK